MMHCLSDDDQNAEMSRRPLANFLPDIWGDQLLHLDCTSPDEVTQNQKQEEAKYLKELVRRELVAVTQNPKERLEYIDAILRLGVGYHFAKEIEDNLQIFHNNLHFDDCYEDDLHYVSLRFRLLRQHGLHVPCDIFEKFKCKNGNFEGSFASDVQGILSLYEASYLRVHGETTLDEALAFATTCLTSFAAQLSSSMAEQIAHSLELPLHKRSIRLESRYQIKFYESKPSHDKTLLRFAKLDFNLLQVLHKIELKDFIRWSRSFDMIIKLPKFARNRAVEIYFWSLGAYYEPDYAYARKFVCKMLNIISIVDDIYDSYGTIEELVSFTEAIQRWNESYKNQLPEYMRLFYQAILDTFEEFEQLLSRDERSYVVNYLREQLKVGSQGYLQEAKWRLEKFVPTYDEYVKNGLISASYLSILAASFLGLGEIANKDAFEWIHKKSKAPRASSLYSRLSNDLAGHKDEKKRDHVASAVECFMKQFGTSEEEAYEKIQLHMEEEWKKINQAMLRPTIIPRIPLTTFINLSRVLHDFYEVGKDAYTVGKYLQPKVEAVLIDPVLIT